MPACRPKPHSLLKSLGQGVSKKRAKKMLRPQRQTKRLDRRERLLTGLISIGIFFGGSILRVLHLPKLLGSTQHPGRVAGNQRLTSKEIE